MNGMQNDFEYGTGIEPLHHPEKYNGGKGESRNSAGSFHKDGTGTFQAGWHRSSPNPLDALDESAYFPNLYRQDGKNLAGDEFDEDDEDEER